MNKKNKSTNTSPYPDEVIDRLARAFYPAILACWNSEEGQRSLVGARPLHLAYARPFGRLKAPLGLSLLRCASQTRACLWQAEQAHPYYQQRETERSRRGTPCCTYRYCLWSLAGCILFRGAPCFCFALNLLTHGFRLLFSNIPSDCHSESNPHSPAGIVDEISISTTTPWSMLSLCWVGSLNITSHSAVTTADWKINTYL